MYKFLTAFLLFGLFSEVVEAQEKLFKFGTEQDLSALVQGKKARANQLIG